MKTVITLNQSRQDAALETNEKNTKSPYPLSKLAGSSWSDHSQSLQPAEEDMYDPDLAAGFSGTRGYMLQPG